MGLEFTGFRKAGKGWHLPRRREGDLGKREVNSRRGTRRGEREKAAAQEEDRAMGKGPG